MSVYFKYTAEKGADVKASKEPGETFLDRKLRNEEDVVEWGISEGGIFMAGS